MFIFVKGLFVHKQKNAAMDYLQKFVGYIETHDVEGIKECFENGISPNDLFRGDPLIHELTSEYTRTPRFKDCVKAFIDYGLKYDDPAFMAVLLDDAISLDTQIHANPGILTHTDTIRCAYTPLYKASLLHICAEYNLIACAEVLIYYGADIEAKAGIDEFGFGDQTPLFHTVNQNSDNSKEVLDLLIAKGADLKHTVSGLIWGGGYPWETLIPAVNPISYAMMGLLPQMQRNPQTISRTVSQLLKVAYGIDYFEKNLPNKYLNG